MNCKECNKNYKRLTKEELCAYCYKNINVEWAKEFQDSNQKKKGA